MILGIESSCDESALALFDPGRGTVASLIHSQLELHGRYGGVVPDLAAREHLERFPVLFRELSAAHDLSRVDRVAVTRGPGLAGCLAIGISAAKGVALLRGCPVMGINHLSGHAWSPFLRSHAEDPEGFPSQLRSLLPHLGLIVSGGNTILFRIGADRAMEVLAETRDDAAGEALDKGAKLLGLPYPGGPEIERRSRAGDPGVFPFPRAFADPRDRAFSFSGLKTSLRYRIEKMDSEELSANLDDLCASYQEAAVDALVRKFRQVLRAETGVRSLGLSGGVANNGLLRRRFEALAHEAGLPGLAAGPAICGDNAAMIAFAAFVDPESAARSGNRLGFEPSLPLGA
ncbi:MAG: tRNA (adenosine(37)-N6)-threonylcarbamoyltransferase complex transferase subunit TsaD [Puniceicoccaceae bacterium]